MRIPRSVSRLLPVILWPFLVELPAAKSAENITVAVTACRVSERDLGKLGFDWMVRPPNGPVAVGGAPTPREPTARLCGSLVSGQFEGMKRALGVGGVELKKLSPLRVGGEARIDSPWDRTRSGFSLKLKIEPPGVEVSVKDSEPQSIVINGNTLLYDVPSAEEGMHELYFVSVAAEWEAIAVLPDAEKKQPQVQIATGVIEMPEADYERHRAELDEAVRVGDLKRLATFENAGLSLSSLPKVTVRSGQKAIIELIREFIYPTEYDRGVDGRLTPTSFETANLGIELPLTATCAEGEIQLDGQLIVRVFEGFTQGAIGTFAPAFQTTEAHFLRTLKNGQTAGFCLPGARAVRKCSGGIESSIATPADRRADATEEARGRSKLAFIVRARQAFLEPPFPSSARLEVKAYDVSETALGKSFLSKSRIGGGSRVCWLAAVLGRKDAVPERAVEFPVTSESADHFKFRTPAGYQGGVKREPQSSDAEITFDNGLDADHRHPAFSAPSLAFAEGSKALMVASREAPAKSEAFLIVFRKKTGTVTESESVANPKPPTGKTPLGTPVTGKPGFVTSPYAAKDGSIDVRGYQPGAEVKDPYSGKMFRVP